MEEKILKILSNILKVEYRNIENKLEIPKQKEMWDFAFPTFYLAKKWEKNPKIIAEDIADKLKKLNNGFFEKIETKWGYINFFMSKDVYNNIFEEIYNKNIGGKKENKKTTIFIDYIWPNVWKPLHIWHMCSPNLWQVIINIYKKLGYKVISDTHIWDWGIIFWKLIIAYQNWWQDEKLKENWIEHLFDLYIKATKEEEKDPSWKDKFQEAFKKLSNQNKEYIKLWKLFTKQSINSIQKNLERLNVSPDYNIWESFYEWLKLPKLENYPNLKFSMKNIVEELIKKWIAIKNKDWSVWVDFSEFLNLPSCILAKKNWTHGYLASDLASVKYRMQHFRPEKIIYFVDSRQSLHLQQVFSISKLAGWTQWHTKLIHAANGFVSLEDWKISTRKWKIIRLKTLLDKAEEKTWQLLKDKWKTKNINELKKIISIWAIKYDYLKKNRELDVVFKWDEFITFEWNSAPYIMYTYTRWKSILKKTWMIWKIKKFNFTEKEEIELIKKLLDYKKILNKTLEWNYPHILANYTYELTKLFNNFYNNINVLKEPNKQSKKSKIALIKQTTSTIKESFELLWIQMPEEM